MTLFGLLGKSLSHSFSKKYFTQKFEQEGLLGYRYENFELQNLQEELQALKSNTALKGLNVTIPYKTEILPFLDGKSAACAAVNACNCIKVSEGKWWGYNTDVYGFENSFLPHKKFWHHKALILGTGGAAAAVKFVLEEQNIPFLSVSRGLSDSGSAIRYEQVSAEVLSEYNIVINTTPVGMFPDIEAAPKLPYDSVTESNYFYDLIYNPGKTRFLSLAEEKGATVVNGAEMLILQAEESWKIWNS